MNYIVYKTTNLINGKFYVGIHGTENPEVFDGYFGSGVYLKNAIKKHGKENFLRETLIDCFDDHEEAYSIELMLVKTKDLDPRSYNLAPGGTGNKDLGKKYSSIGGTTSFINKAGLHGASTEQKSVWGKIGGNLGGVTARDNCVGLFSPEQQSRMIEYGLVGGKKCKDEQLGFFAMSEENRSAARLRGTINGMESNLGIHTADLKKRSEWARLGGKKSSGSLFYNDGTRNWKFNPNRENISFNDFLSINVQFSIGKIFVSKDRKSNAGKKAYHNGETEYKFVSSNPGDKELTEIEFTNFLLSNPQFIRGRINRIK